MSHDWGDCNCMNYIMLAVLVIQQWMTQLRPKNWNLEIPLENDHLSPTTTTSTKCWVPRIAIRVVTKVSSQTINVSKLDVYSIFDCQTLLQVCSCSRCITGLLQPMPYNSFSLESTKSYSILVLELLFSRCLVLLEISRVMTMTAAVVPSWCGWQELASASRNSICI